MAHLPQQHQQQAKYHQSLGLLRCCSSGSRLRGGTTTAPTWSGCSPSLCPKPSKCPVKTMLLIRFPVFLLQIFSCCLIVIHQVCINWGIHSQTLNIIDNIMNINHKKPTALIGNRICRNISATICFAQTPECFLFHREQQFSLVKFPLVFSEGLQHIKKSAWSLFVYLYLP